MNYAESEGGQNLLKLADILDVADRQHTERGEPRYTQRKWGHGCGTPACAAGHWVAANPEKFRLVGVSRESDEVGIAILSLCGPNRALPYMGVMELMQKEFGIDQLEAVELFNLYGCGRAQTSEEAAAYIREFVFRKSRCEV